MQKRTLKVLLTFMGACTPGGFLFLFALLTHSNFRMDPIVWYLMAAGGGVGGYLLAKKHV
jgi:hypothetical protein